MTKEALGAAAFLVTVLLLGASGAAAQATDFVIGDRIATLVHLNSRFDASLSSRILTVHARGEEGTVLAGPRYANGYRWWYIDWTTGTDGWSADFFLRKIGTPSPVNISPSPVPESPPTTVAPANSPRTATPTPQSPQSPSVSASVSAVGSKSRVSFDASGHILIKGVPRFILGVYDSGLSFTTDEEYYENALFASDGRRKLGGIPLNFYLNYFYGSASVPALTALMNVLGRHGMMYWQTANSFDSGSYKRYDTAQGPAFTIDKSPENIKQLAAHPNYAGVYIADEPDDSLVPETIEHSNYILRADPGAVNFIALINSYYRDLTKWAGIPGLLSIDPYPMVGQHNSQYWVADSVARLRMAVGRSRPIIAVNQFFQFQGSPFPNYGQLKTNAIMSIVEGAQGIVWWSVGTAGVQKSGESTKAAAMANLKRLATVLHELEPALLAPAAPQALTGNSTCVANPVAWRQVALKHNLEVEWLRSAKDSFESELSALQKGDTSQSYLLDQACDVRTLVKIVNGKGYVFAYNYTDKNIGPVTLVWRSDIARVDVVDESRSITAAGGRFSDSFGPYESHLYAITERADGSSIVSSPPPQPVNREPAAPRNPTPNPVAVTVAPTVTVTSTSDNACTAQATAAFKAAFQYPAPNSNVSGLQTVGMKTTADWGDPKKITITLGCSGPILFSKSTTSVVEWFMWDTTAAPNGAHSLVLSVAYGDETVRALLPITVAN